MCTDCGQGLACVLVKVQLFGLRFHDGLCLPDVILHHVAWQVQSAPHNVYVCVCACVCVCVFVCVRRTPIPTSLPSLATYPTASVHPAPLSRLGAAEKISGGD